MRRRTFLLGVGSTAIGVGTLVGSGAFSSATMEREAKINVVDDSAGVLSLIDTTESDVVHQTEGGELAIDFNQNGAGGVNVNAEYQIGEIVDAEFSSDEVLDDGSPQTSPAFEIHNRDTVAHELEVEYEFEDGAGDSMLYVQLENADGEIGEIWWRGSGDNDLSAAVDVDPGETVGVSIYIQTFDGDPDDDLSGSMTVSA